MRSVTLGSTLGPTRNVQCGRYGNGELVKGIFELANEAWSESNGVRSFGGKKKTPVSGKCETPPNSMRNAEVAEAIRSSSARINPMSVPSGIGPTPDEPAKVISTG